MSEHLGLDELAELDAGLLARRQAAAATRHLAECEECAARTDALRRAQSALHDLGPVTMPADVAERIDRALSAAATTTSETVVPDLGSYRTRRRGMPAWAYAAAAALVVVGGVGIAIGTLGGDDAAPSTAANAPIVSTSAPAELIEANTGQTYTPSSVSTLAPNLLAVSAQADAAGVAPSDSGSGGGAASERASTPSELSTTKSAPAPAMAARTADVPAPLRRLADSRTALLRCAAFISDTPGASPLAVDFGRWTNADAGLHRVPAVIFVFADSEDPESITVFVVAAACDDSSLLDFRVLDRTP